MIEQTEAAELERFDDGSLEVRFKEGIKLTRERIHEVLDARERLSGKGAYGVIVTLPEDFDFDINVLLNDHYQDRELHNCTYAVAWDAETATNEKLVEIFYKYFPQRFPVAVFRTQSEAREWLAQNMPKKDQ